MIYSMTGFATARAELGHGSLNLELRSVNHRYLEIQFRMNDELRILEPAIRERIAQQITRGKLDCRVSYSPLDPGKGMPEINTALLEQLVQLNNQVKTRMPDARSLSVAEVLQWQGMFGADLPPAESLQQAALALLDSVLAELNQTRQREGEKLKDLLMERAGQIDALAAAVAPKIPEIVAAFQAKLSARLKEAIGSADDDRIRQELALFAQKIDVDEELSRLQTHVTEVRRVLNKGGAVGKRLDFLMQELNREANTLGSKSVVSEVSQASMELKVLIEQMREQIQNIE